MRAVNIRGKQFIIRALSRIVTGNLAFIGSWMMEKFDKVDRGEDEYSGTHRQFSTRRIDVYTGTM